MVSEVSRFPVPLDTGTRPLHGVSSTSSEFTGTATRRNRSNVILLHRLPQARCLALKRRWPRHIVVRTEKAIRPPLRIVEGAAARPLTERLARDGTTGKFPAIIRAPLICSREAAIP